MLKRKFVQTVFASAFALTSWAAHAADAVPVLFGKDDWLYTPYEFAQPSDAADTQATIGLFQKVNKLFEQKGIALALVIVPSKVRIHADHLPDEKPLDSYTAGKYENAYKQLREGGVNVVNLNQAFLASPNRTSDTPLFLRLDTHWSPAGSSLAAETIKSVIMSTPALKAALDATPAVGYTLNVDKKKTVTRARDLVRLLPKEQQTYGPEQVLGFKVVRNVASQASLQGSGDAIGVLAIGSSYSNPNTGYGDALRYQLQRDVLNISIPVDQGPWVGMEAYLKDEAYKTSPPKLIIWEIPERELRSPPNAKFRDARYQFDNNEWLNRIAALLK